MSIRCGVYSGTLKRCTGVVDKRNMCRYHAMRDLVPDTELPEAPAFEYTEEDERAYWGEDFHRVYPRGMKP